ncbi:MAG: protein-disulfide reductase DsbD [Pseudomonadales bacterium]|nr:protein-disulfide reductase DsbD [Pseudomonadales bacterium]
MDISTRTTVGLARAAGDMRVALGQYASFWAICLALLAVLLSTTLTLSARAQDVDLNQFLSQGPEFLKADQAFRMDAEIDAEGRLHAFWQMPDGYYLYEHRFGIKLRENSLWQIGELEISEGKHKVDEYFGAVVVHYHSAEVWASLQYAQLAQNLPESLEVGISYQGCADAGLCYPPETKWVTLSTTGLAPALFSPGAAVDKAVQDNSVTPADLDKEDLSTKSATELSDMPLVQTEERRLASMLSDGSRLKSILLFFLAGIGLAFTPCVLPMVPILSSIIVGQGEDIARSRAFGLSLVYVLGMALTYALVGVLMGFFGASMNLQAALQSPPLLIFFAGVFFILSLSMFGFYELQLPQAIQDRLHSANEGRSGGKYTSVFVMGSLSSLVVSPCVSAPLAGALIYISQSEDALLGGGVLLALGLGMGVPLLVIGSSGGHLLPRAGGWMDGVKAVFGVGLLAVAVWLLERVLPGTVTMALWAVLAIGSGVYLGALDFSPRKGWGQLWKASGAILFIYGVILLIGASSGADNPFKPLSSARAGMQSTTLQELPEFIDINNLSELQAELANASVENKPVFLDFYADWCISCKVMERDVFPEPRISRLLAQFHLVRADVTEYNEEHKALLREYDLPGPPSMIFYTASSRELTELRVSGEMHAEAFGDHLMHILSL